MSDVQIVHESPTPSTRRYLPPPPEFLDEWLANPNYHGKLDEFMKYMLGSQKLTDVVFLLKSKNNEEVKVKAHKCILKVKSDFFRVLFSNKWEQQEVINLCTTGMTDIDFLCFLEYLYVGKVEITKDNVLTLYNLSNMYLTSKNALKDMCEEFLDAHIDINDNACALFNTVFAFNEGKKTELLEKVIEKIFGGKEEMLDNTDFKSMDMASLSMIFRSGEFECHPLKLLRFCLGWIKYHYGQKALHDFEKVDKRIRQEFNVKISTSLQTELNGSPSNPDAINGKVKRFNQVSAKDWIYRRNRSDRISFRVSDAIILTGLGLYGCKDYDAESPYAKYDLDIKIYVHGKQRNEVLNFITRGGGTEMSFVTRIYKVDVEPCYLQPDTWYTIAVKISGGRSYYGEKGEEAILTQCGKMPLVFEFQEASLSDDNAKLSNATGVPVGQIPELYFKLASDGTDDEVRIL